MTMERDAKTADKTFLCHISSTIMADYLRRSVFPELNAKNTKHVTKGGWHVFDNVPRQLGKRILEDALEQEAIKRGAPGRGLRMAYMAHVKRARVWLRYDWRAGLRNHEIDLDNYAPGRIAVAGLLLRLGIPAAKSFGQ